ncbi:Protein SPT3 [Saitozyma sp. JCM 24511]|nr:Protein SPT3 [Saitozyma sp. JCM 24511]
MSTLALPPSASTPTSSKLALPTLPRRPSALSNPASTIPPANTTSNTLAKGDAAAGPSRERASNSPVKDEEDEEDGMMSDEEDEGAAKKKGGASRKKKAGEGGKEYKYSSEISQMMFVFGEVQDPLPETVRLVEDVVRGQIIEIVTRARLLTHLRSSRYLSAEDLIFLIRDDRGKVNRLRTYLSWKDVRKRAKDDEGGAGGEGDVDIDDAEKAAAKGRKSMVKLPWELLTPFSEFLRGVPSKQNREDDEDEDEDEMQAHQDSMQRLRDADEITKKMTKDEYVHYSDCRQASFTYRKARRFREFINFSAYLDVRPNDDIIDILGFLSFEMVRSLCVTALEVRERLERTAPTASESGQGAQHGRRGTMGQRTITSGPSPTKRKAGAGAGAGTGTAETDAQSPLKRARVESPESMTASAGTGAGANPEQVSGQAQTQSQNLRGGSEPASATAVNPTVTADTQASTNTTDTNANANAASTGATTSTRRHAHYPISLFAPPPSARQPLLPAHVLEAFAQIQRKEAAGRGGGMRNFRGGMSRGRVALV